VLSKPASFDRLSDDMGRDGLSLGMGVLGRALGPWPLRGVFTFTLKTAPPLSVLSVIGKTLRRPCLDRFAVFAKASRNSIEKRRQAGRSAACPFDCAGEI
jgi:hypothetical protein